MKEKERMFDITLRLEKITKKSIAENQMSRSRLAKKKSWQERGITLIALVVTIIILLILAGVTLNIALSDGGLFSKTQEAADKYKQAQSDEEEMIRQIATQMYSEYVGAEVTGYDLKDNDKMEYKATTEETGYTEEQTINRDEMTWKIWDFDGNILRIIGDPTSTKLYLKGAAGYNNGVKTLDNICKQLYENHKNGVTATNLKRSDIQKVSTYDYTNYKHTQNSTTEVPNGNASDTIQFGETRKYDNAQYPEMWDIKDRNWTYEWNDDGTIIEKDKECISWETIESEENMGNVMKVGDGQETFKQSYYSHVYQEDEFINDKYYDLIFKKDNEKFMADYWLSGRITKCQSDTLAIFGISAVRFNENNTRMGCQDLCITNGVNDGFAGFAIRPIVSINLRNSKCTLTPLTGTEGEIKYELSFAE